METLKSGSQQNHRHIAQIYGVEDADGTICLVLELFEGETLADRLTCRAG